VDQELGSTIATLTQTGGVSTTERQIVPSA
jgi:hypothetical protein